MGRSTPARGALAGALASAAVIGMLTAGPAGATDPKGYTSDCPAPESLVSGTTWHSHKLSAGVTLKEGRHSDATGYVDMHVLSVDVTNRHVALAPLSRRLAQRSPLSQLAAGRSALVAATNTGFFDFDRGTPLSPLVERKRPVVSSATGGRAVGLTTAGVMAAGRVRLVGTMTVGKSTQPLAALNVVRPRASGLTAYTPRWGATSVALPDDAVSRYVAGGQVSSAVGRFDSVATSGYLVVARGTAATTWLSGLRKGATVTFSTQAVSDTKRPFKVAYGVSSRLVHAGVAATTLTCRRRYPQPARTAIGFANHGQRLILAVVTDRPGTEMHGLAANQMARVMKDLGAGEAYSFDGSGSSELLARMPKAPTTMTLRTYPADGVERPMPLGFGIFKR